MPSAAMMIGGAAKDLLYSVSPSDPAVLTSVALLVLGVAAVASIIPAWLATGRDARGILQGD